LQKKRNFQTNFLFDNSNIILGENHFFINNSFRIYKKDIEQTNYIQNKNEKLNENKIIYSNFKIFKDNIINFNEFKKELESNDKTEFNKILNYSNINFFKIYLQIKINIF